MSNDNGEKTTTLAAVDTGLRLAQTAEGVLAHLPDADAVVALVKWRGEVMEKMCDAALAQAAKEFKGRGFVDFQGQPHPEESVVAKILDATGVHISPGIPYITTERAEDERGWYWIARCSGEASLPDLHIPARAVVGIASSRDPFFSRSRGEDIPQSEIRRENVEKKAETNMKFRAACSILGLRAALTWERLKQFGIKQDGAASVTFGGGAAAEIAKRKCPQCGKQLRLVAPKAGQDFPPFISCRGWRKDKTGCDYQEDYTPQAEAPPQDEPSDSDRRVLLVGELNVMASDLGLKKAAFQRFIKEAIGREGVESFKDLATTELLTLKEALEARAEGASSE